MWQADRSEISLMGKEKGESGEGKGLRGAFKGKVNRVSV